MSRGTSVRRVPPETPIRLTELGRAGDGTPDVHLASSPRLAALRAAGTRHVYGDTADVDELRSVIGTGDGAVLEEVDGNTINQPLLSKVLPRLIEDEDPVERAALLLREAGADPREQMPSIYAVLCARAANAMTRAFAAGRAWEPSLQLHMGLGEWYEDSLHVGRFLRSLAPNAIVKVPFTPAHPQALLVARDLERGGVPVNLTSTFSARQVVVGALLAGVARTNVFMGRLDQGLEARLLGEHVVLAAQRALRELREKDGVRTQLIVASLRDSRSIDRLAGCDVFTSPPDVLEEFLGREGELPSRVDATYEVEVSEAVKSRLDPDAIDRLSRVEPELLEFLRDLRRAPDFVELKDGYELHRRFDEAGFADLFHAPTGEEHAEARRGKLPDLDGTLVRTVPLDTHYSLLANADFEKHQAEIDEAVRKALPG